MTLMYRNLTNSYNNIHVVKVMLGGKAICLFVYIWTRMHSIDIGNSEHAYRPGRLCPILFSKQ